MRIVVDTNRIIASLITRGLSREILLNSGFDFFCPEDVLEELEDHKSEIMDKAELNKESFQLLLDFLFEKIQVIPRADFSEFLQECSKLIKDQDDVVFLALSLALNAEGIWTEDKGFREQKRVRIYNNQEMLELMS